MALSANTVFEVMQGGSDTNGGGFVTGASGTDWSQQTSAQYSVTDGVTAGTTTITSATATFGTDVVGNIIYVQGGTGSVAAGWYQIISRTNSTTIVVDRSTGLTAGTGVTLKIGGALATPGGSGLVIAANSVAGITVFIKYDASPYIATTASTNVAGGCVLGPNNVYWVGYDLSRTRYPAPGGNRPTFKIDTGISSAVLFTGTNNGYFLQNIILDCNSQATSRGGLQSGEYYYVKVINGIWGTTGGPLQDNSAGRAILCEVSGCTLTGGAAALRMNGNAFFCTVHDNSASSNTAAMSVVTAVGCVIYGNTTGMGANITAVALNCVAYGNAQGGFFPGNGSPTFINCISESNGTYGWVGGTQRPVLIKCSSYGNATARANPATGQIIDIDPITTSASAFVDAASQDFRLNSEAGAVLFGVGFPTSFPMSASNITYPDIGALQHFRALLMHPGMSGGMA
jgi:hypothetical protein